MSIPKFHQLMLPLLKKYQDGQAHSAQDFLEILSQEFGLSEKEKEERVSSGQSRMLDRIAWAKTYLFKAGLLQQIKRNEYQIT